MDESTDKKQFGQAILYERHIDMSQHCLVEGFLAILRIKGSPNHNNLFSTLNGFVTEKELPKEKLCGFAADGAAVMQSLGRGVAGLLKITYNPNLFIQHCIVHKEVLGTKDGMKDSIPQFVEKTVKKVLDFFANSYVRADRLAEIIELSDEDHEYNQLVRYHAVRWLSLSGCVDRFVSLFREVSEYFETEAHDMSKKVDHRKTCGELYENISGGEFELYLQFLKDALKILARMNTVLQYAGHTVYSSYLTINDVMQEFLEPIVWNERKPWDEILQEENIREFDRDMVFHSGVFNERKDQLIQNGVLTNREADEVHKNCYKFILNTGKAIQTRFPELHFVVQNMSFMLPELRASPKLRHCNLEAVIEKYVPNRFDVNEIKEQFRTYRFSSDLDVLAEETGNVPDVFFCHLAERESFKTFAEFTLTLTCLSPTTVSCERGFSTMNLIKTEKRGRLTEDNLNALMILSTDKRDQDSFPIRKAMKHASTS
jgi:hypothetical protein